MEIKINKNSEFLIEEPRLIEKIDEF